MIIWMQGTIHMMNMKVKLIKVTIILKGKEVDPQM